MKDVLKRFSENLSSLYEGNDVRIILNGIDNRKENLVTIEKTILVDREARFGGIIPNNIRIYVMVGKGSSELMSATLTEFPCCCGKCIASGLSVRNYFVNEKGNGVEVPETKLKESIRLFYGFIIDFLKSIKYTSCSLIVSEIDNPLLYQLIQGEKFLRHTGEFKNKRNSHVCHEYLLSDLEI